MQSVIKNAKTDYKKARSLMLLSDYWSYRDTAKAFEQLRLAEKYIKNDNSLKGLSLIYKAGIIYDLDIEKSQKIYLEAEEILKHIPKKIVYDDRAILWHNYAALEKLKGKNKAFIDIIIKKCIPLVEISGNTFLHGNYQTDIGLTLYEIKDYKGAEKYFFKAINTLSSLKKENTPLLWTYINLAHLYLVTEKHSSAKEYLDKSEKLLSKFPDQYTSLYYLYLGQYFSETDKDQQAIKTLDQGIEIAKKLNITYDIQSMSYEKFKLLRKQGKKEEAYTLINAILKNVPYDNPLQKIQFLKDISEMDNENGNYKIGYNHLLEYERLKDSISKSESIRDVQELETKYRTAEKEKQIILAQNKTKQQRIIFLSIAIILFGSLIFTLYALAQRKKRNKKQIAIINQKKEIEVSKALLEGEELERTRISKELHDGLGGRIMGLKMKLEGANENLNSKILDDATTQLKTILNELRGTTKNLMPETLLKYGLENALKSFLQSMSNDNLNIALQCNDLHEIEDKTQQINIFRIIQELVTNSVRHGKAKDILVQIHKEDKLLLIDVEDDGIGFNPDNITKNLGMYNIEMRVYILNGTVKYNSTIGEGTTTNITCNL